MHCGMRKYASNKTSQLWVIVNKLTLLAKFTFLYARLKNGRSYVNICGKRAAGCFR